MVDAKEIKVPDIQPADFIIKIFDADAEQKPVVKGNKFNIAVDDKKAKQIEMKEDGILKTPKAKTSILVRVSAIGWMDAPSNGATTIVPRITSPAVGWNKGRVQIYPIDRLPIGSLTTANSINDHDKAAAESPVQRSISLVPWYIDPIEQKVDVLIHFHGFNVGYRQRLTDGSSLGNKKGSVRDIDLDRFEEQLKTWGMRGKHLIGVLAQGTNQEKDSNGKIFIKGSIFGSGDEGMLADPNAYLNEIFMVLINQKILPIGAKPSRTILSAHSGGGRVLSKMLESGNLPSNVSMVIILDAINSNIQLNRYVNWVKAQIVKDITAMSGKAEPDQLDYLDSSMRFFGFYSDSSFYVPFYQTLTKEISDWIKSQGKMPPLASSNVRSKLANNYPVIHVGNGHDEIIGNPSPELQMGRPIEFALAKFPPH